MREGGIRFPGIITNFWGELGLQDGLTKFVILTAPAQNFGSFPEAEKDVTRRLIMKAPHTHMCGCQNYGPFLGTLNIRCRILVGIQKGARILTTTHIPSHFDRKAFQAVADTSKPHQEGTPPLAHQNGNRVAPNLNPKP